MGCPHGGWMPVIVKAASKAGYTVVDPTTAVSTHLSETVRTFLPDLLTRQQVKEMLDHVAQNGSEVNRGARAKASPGSETSSECFASCSGSVCRCAT